MDSTNKLDFINDKPALFMDDSFSERRLVDSDNIYVLDIDSSELARDILRASFKT